MKKHALVALVSLSLSFTLSGCLLGGGSEPDPVATPVPQQVQGVWLDAWSASMDYCLATEMYDFDTGVWFQGAQSPWDMACRGIGITFDDAGHFTWIMATDGGQGGCKSYAIDFIKGTTAPESNGAIRFHATQRRQKYHSTCDPSLDYDRDASGGNFTMTYSVGATQDTGEPTLTMTDPAEGSSWVFYRK